MTPLEKIKCVLHCIRSARPELELELELDPSRFRALTDEVAKRAEIPSVIATSVLRDILSFHPAAVDSPRSHRGTVREIPIAVDRIAETPSSDREGAPRRSRS